MLNVGEVVRAVHPRPQDPVPVPSPFPYLPANPQELLRMYLEVVGVRAADCYSAQVTVNSYRELSGRILDEGSTNMGPKQPCADGKDRGRIHGAEHVVVTYRDSPDYAEGRARWAAYQQEVLLAHLERQTHVRLPVEDFEGSYVDQRPDPGRGDRCSAAPSASPRSVSAGRHPRSGTAGPRSAEPRLRLRAPWP